MAAAYENRQAVGGVIGQFFLCLLPPQKLKENPGDGTRSKDEEDDDNKEEEDCSTTTAAAAGAAAATAAATTGLHTSYAATASDQAVAAVAAAGRSGLRWGAVAAAADSRMPMSSLAPAFLCFLLNVRYTWHRIPCFIGHSLRIPARFRVPEDSGTKQSCPGSGI